MVWFGGVSVILKKLKMLALGGAMHA